MKPRRMILAEVKLNIFGEPKDDPNYDDPSFEAAEEIIDKIKTYARRLCDEAGFGLGEVDG